MKSEIGLSPHTVFWLGLLELLAVESQGATCRRSKLTSIKRKFYLAK